MSIGERQSTILEVAKSLAPSFAERAAEHDRENTFPYENYDEIKRAGYHAATLPLEVGGLGAGLFDLCLGQEELAVGDGGTALGIGMHLSLLGRLVEDQSWPTEMWERVARRGGTRERINARSRAAMGSPSRGGMPTTTAVRVDGGWEITGRKTFTTIAPVLDYFVVLAGGGRGEPGQLPCAEGYAGAERRGDVGRAWDALHRLARPGAGGGARARRAYIPPPSKPDTTGGGRAWAALSLGAVYLGVARAARDFAASFARDRVPTGLGKPISELPNVQQNLGRMELSIRAARSVLHGAARAWEDDPEHRADLASDVAAAKHLATNCAIDTTDLAMRLVGGSALARDLPLERLFRDARAGLYNPPSDDAALQTLGQWVLGDRPKLA
ncbi:MAG: acyl-CoA dehydrogenase family protein [Chloroflexia bacterium]